MAAASPSPSAPRVGSLREWHHAVGFGTMMLYRTNQEIGWTRASPTPGNNVVAEVLTLAGAASGLQPYDVQRVYELLGTRTGDGVAMVFKEPEAKILGRSIDMLLRAVARQDQTAHCVARTADLMLELVRHLYADAGAYQREQAHQQGLIEAIASVGKGPVTIDVMHRVPEYPRIGTTAIVTAARGRDWTPSFGPAANAYAGPTWVDPFDDGSLADGHDPRTARTGHVEGW